MKKLNPDNFTQFTKTTPWGYNPEEVEKQIKEYENTIQKLNDKVLEQGHICQNLTNKIEKLQDELREMHIQMSSLEMPDVAEAVGHYVLEDFKNHNFSNKKNINKKNIEISNDENKNNQLDIPNEKNQNNNDINVDNDSDDSDNNDSSGNDLFTIIQ